MYENKDDCSTELFHIRVAAVSRNVITIIYAFPIYLLSLGSPISQLKRRL